MIDVNRDFALERARHVLPPDSGHVPLIAMADAFLRFLTAGENASGRRRALLHATQGLERRYDPGAADAIVTAAGEFLGWLTPAPNVNPPSTSVVGSMEVKGGDAHGGVTPAAGDPLSR